MADATSAPYESVKNRRSRAPNKRPYDSFAEGTPAADPNPSNKIHNQPRANAEVHTPPVEQNILIDLQRVENERRDLLRSIIGKLNRQSLETLLVDAGLEHKAVMSNVIAANTNPRNWLTNGDITHQQPQQALFMHPASGPAAPRGLASRPVVPNFIAQYSHHELVTPPTEPRPYTTPYPPLPPPPAPPAESVPKSKKKGPAKELVDVNALITPKSRNKAKAKQPQSAPAESATTPKVKKPTRPYSAKKFSGRGPGRWPRGSTKDDETTPAPAKTASGRPVKRTRYTELETDEEDDEDDDDEELEQEDRVAGENDEEDAGDTEVEEVEDAVTDSKGKGKAAAMAEDAAAQVDTFKNGKPKRGKNPADKNKDQTMIPVGILKGSVNVALSGFDRRMGLIFRTSRYNRDGEFVGLQEGMSRSIKRDKVDFHPVLSSLTEDELRKEILRRQEKIGYQIPPGRSI